MADRDPREHVVTRVNVQTTDATVTNLATYTPANSSIVLVHVDVEGVRNTAAGAESVLGRFTRLYRKSSAGAGVVEGTTGQNEAFGASGYTITVDNSSGTVRVRGTGTASETVHWVGRVTFDCYEASIG